MSRSAPAVSRRSRFAVWAGAVALAVVLLACSPFALVASGSLRPKAQSFAWGRLVVGVMYINAICPGRERELCQWLGLYYEVYEEDGKMIRAKDMLPIPIARGS